MSASENNSYLRKKEMLVCPAEENGNLCTRPVEELTPERLATNFTNYSKELRGIRAIRGQAFSEFVAPCGGGTNRVGFPCRGARPVGAGLGLWRKLRQLDRPMLLRRKIGGKDDAMAFEGGIETCQRHGAPVTDTLHESLELRPIRMVADVAGINQGCFQSAPSLLGHALQVLSVEAIVQQAPLATDQMNVKVVRLQAVDDGSNLADGATSELEESYRRGVVLVRFELTVLRARAVRGHFFHCIVHEKKQRIQSMAPGR